MILASVNNLTYYGKTLPAHRKNADQASSLNLSTEKKKIFGKEFLNLQKVSMNQVWPPTQFFSVSFLQKIFDLPGGQINVPSSGKHWVIGSQGIGLTSLDPNLAQNFKES